MDKIQQKLNDLYSEAQGLVEERKELESKINLLNHRLIEIEGAYKTLQQLQSEQVPPASE